MLLLFGIVALIVGYIGCFAIVQSAQVPAGSISWLFLEGGLSILRLILWGLNPTFDDSPPLELFLELDKQAPLPTCMKNDEEITVERVLPITRASEFLSSITSFVGLIKHFNHPDLTLYYTLTRKVVGQSIFPRSTHAAMPEPIERILYITVFDHRERTTRIYTQDTNAQDKFYSAASPFLNLEYDQLETKLGGLMVRQNDPVAANDEIRNALSAHYRSIIDQINDTCTRQATKDSDGYSLVNKWTMLARDTLSRLEWQKQQGVEQPSYGAGAPCILDNSLEVDHQLLQLGWVEKKRRSLVASRGRWIVNYLAWVTDELRHLPHRVNGVKQEPVQPEGLYEKVIRNLEMCEMEMLLIEEVEKWEDQLLDRVRKFSDTLDAKGKRQLAKMWSQSCRNRFGTEMDAMDARIKAIRELNKGSEKDFGQDLERHLHDRSTGPGSP